MAFLNQNTLLTGEGALKQGDEIVRVFDLPADGKPLKFDDAKQILHPTADAKSQSQRLRQFLRPGFYFHCPVRKSPTAPMTRPGCSKPISRATELYDELKPFVQNKAVTKIDALLGIASVYHGFLVLGPRRRNEKPDAKGRHQSLLAFYNAKSGNLLMSLPTGLHDITGLAYSPKSGRLYAVDFAWDDPSQGGLYRLDAATIDNRSGVKAVKMTSLDKPSALVFASDNVLYVTTFGSLPPNRNPTSPPSPASS